MRAMVLGGLLAGCAACSDPGAVRMFAGMAPGPAMAQGLTHAYVAQPEWAAQLNQGTGLPPDRDARDQTKQRKDQAKGIIAIDHGIREYMTALGALAADDIVQSDPHVGDLKTGLTALQKGIPNLGITRADVSLISQFIQATARLVEGGYRNAKLAQLIGDNNGALQRTLDIQIEIVNRAMIPEIREYAKIAADKQRFLRSQPATVHYLFDRILAVDQANADLQLVAARSYATALGDIKTAHTALYNNRNDVMSQAMLERIKGPAQNAYEAFQEYQAAIAASTIR